MHLQYVVDMQAWQGRGAQVWRPQEEQWEGRQAGNRQRAIGFSTRTTYSIKYALDLSDPLKPFHRSTNGH